MNSTIILPPLQAKIVFLHNAGNKKHHTANPIFS